MDLRKFSFGHEEKIVGTDLNRSLTSLPIQGALIPKVQGGFAHLITFSGVSIMVGTVIIVAATILRRKEVRV